MVWWSNLQPKGRPTGSADGWFARNLIEDDKGRGIEPVAVVLHTPGWAARDAGYGPISPPANLDLPFDDPNNYWGHFLTRLAREYAGLVDTWILWNEPDIYRETYATWAGSVEEFARMQVVGYQAIKAANPKARVVLAAPPTGGTSRTTARSTWTGWWAPWKRSPGAAENNIFFDAVSVHQYSNPLNCYTVPVLYRRILPATGWTSPSGWTSPTSCPTTTRCARCSAVACVPRWRSRPTT